MSLPQATIDQLREQSDKRSAAEMEIDRLHGVIENFREQVETLELTIATLRRRVESLEGVDS